MSFPRLAVPTELKDHLGWTRAGIEKYLTTPGSFQICWSKTLAYGQRDARQRNRTYLQISTMLFELPPRVPGRSLKRRCDWRRKIDKHSSLVPLELFGFEINRYAANTSRQVYGTLPKDSSVNRASGEIATGSRRMCSIAIIQIDIWICLPHVRPGQANRRDQ